MQLFFCLIQIHHKMELKNLDDKKVMLLINAADLREVIGELVGKIEQPKTLQKEEDERLTINQVVKQYHISKPTLWRWTKVGILHQIRFGGKRLYLRSELEQIMK